MRIFIDTNILISSAMWPESITSKAFSMALLPGNKDRPVLRAAINAGADVLLTGDKDFLASGITSPRIMSASEFLALA